MTFSWERRHSVVFVVLLACEAFGVWVMATRGVLATSASAPDESRQRVFNLPSLTAEQARELEAEGKRAELYIRAPLVLDFPAIVVQMPYILVAPAKREWVPKGMFPETWRALSWPFAGLIFWWLAGRSFEALHAARHGIVYPRLRWIETAFAAILVLIGFAALVGIVTSTPDDRNDVQFVALVAGALLWGTLAAVVIAARFRQWRITGHGAATEASTSPSPE